MYWSGLSGRHDLVGGLSEDWIFALEADRRLQNDRHFTFHFRSWFLLFCDSCLEKMERLGGNKGFCTTSRLQMKR